MLSGRSSLYMTSSRTLIILKDFNFTQFYDLINVNFVFGVLFRKYTLSFFLKVSSLTLFLLATFFIFLLKKIKLFRSFFYNLWISFTYTKVCSTNSSHFRVFSETSASNPLFIKNGILLVILCSKVLYVSILIGNNLTQLVCQQLQKHLRYYFSI